MKADQACIVIFREKTAFRRYMICLFHVLDRLGSLRVGHTKSYDRLRRVPTSYRSEHTSNVRHLCDYPSDRTNVILLTKLRSLTFTCDN